MANIDEAKVKLLMQNVTAKIMQCLPVNVYTKDMWGEIDKMIQNADLLTDQPACATMKKKSKKKSTKTGKQRMEEAWSKMTDDEKFEWKHYDYDG